MVSSGTLERIEGADVLEGASIDLDPRVRMQLVAGLRQAQPDRRIVLTQQMTGHQRTSKTRALAERPRVGHPSRAPDSSAGAGWQLLQWQPLRSGNDRVQVHPATQSPAEPGERDAADQRFDDDDDDECMQRGDDLPGGQTEHAS